MRKRIPIDQLTVGMHIVDLDRSWWETPFWRHRMTVTDRSQIDALKASGIRFVDVEVDGGGADALASCEEEPVAVDPRETAIERSVPGHEVTETAATAFEDELPAARQVYMAAKHVVEDAMHDVRMGREINMERVSRVVSDMADSLLRNPDALASLSRLKRFDEYTFYHSVNTAVLALALGRRLRYDRASLHRLGIGTLLHDIGKTRIPLEILNKPGKFAAHEFEIMKQHVLRGAEILSKTTGLDESCLRPALEHHERVDGTGYPYGRKKSELSLFGMIAAVADIYDAITSDRCYHKAKPPHEALQFLYGLGQRGHLHMGLVQRFIKVVGVYPVGSCVALNTGEIAVVSRLNHQQPLRPTVLIVERGGRRLAKPAELDLDAQVGTPVRSIQTVVDPKAIGVDPGLDPGLVLDGQAS
ncbi:MAG: HD family phosphohydrolase [Nitrospiraceae bacterium]|nr:MAG: HD family phosphohydrolase [Nitrospiraceae bacterium]